VISPCFGQCKSRRYLHSVELANTAAATAKIQALTRRGGRLDSSIWSRPPTVSTSPTRTYRSRALGTMVRYTATRFLILAHEIGGGRRVVIPSSTLRPEVGLGLKRELPRDIPIVDFGER